MKTKIFYRVFLTCMFLCAGMALIGIWWLGPDAKAPWYLPKLIPTTFVIGLASFLLWATQLFKDIHAARLRKEH